MNIEEKYLPPIKISNEGLVAIEAALAAGAAIRNAVGGKVEMKKGISNVKTSADEESGITIRSLIKKSFPNDPVYSEDPVNKQDNPKNPLKELRVWVVDELDGSKNFADKIDNVWVSIAYVERGIVKVSVCYNPILDRLYFAEQTKGAYFLGKEYGGDNWEKRTIHVSDKSDLKDSTVETSIAYLKDKTLNHDLINLVLHQRGFDIRTRGIGSSVEQLCRVAEGKSDLHYHSDLKPWDYAAAYLIVIEAGGIFARMDGSEFNVMCPDSVVGSKNLVGKFVREIRSIKGDKKLIGEFTKRVRDFKI